MADPKGPDDKGRDDAQERRSRPIPRMEADEDLIGRSIVYGAASRPRSRRFHLPSLRRKSRPR